MTEYTEMEPPPGFHRSVCSSSPRVPSELGIALALLGCQQLGRREVIFQMGRAQLGLGFANGFGHVIELGGIDFVSREHRIEMGFLHDKTRADCTCLLLHRGERPFYG